MQFFTLGSSKIEVFETDFFDIVTPQYDHPRYVKHVLGRIYMIFTLFGYQVGGGGGAPRGLVHNLLMQFFTLGSSKIEGFETDFFDIVTPQYDHPRYVKHVLGRIYMIFTLFGYQVGGGGGAPRGLVHNLLMQFFTLGSSKIEIFETCFFDIVITENDYPRYVKHVSGRIYVFSRFFGISSGGGGGGGSQGVGTQPAYAVFHLGKLETQSFHNLFF